MITSNLICQFFGKKSYCVKTLLYLIFLSINSYSFSQQLAFPTAEGFGKYANGGRGGTVIKVTNLNDSGAGSLRDALQYTSGTRTIVFEVGGTITLNSVLSVKDGNVTVAGQTAPGDGILIRGSMVIVEASNVIIRYIRFRPGTNVPANEPDGLSITAWNSDLVENIIIDHCSISWAQDENLDIRSVTSGIVQNISIQNSIISECNYGTLSGPRTFNKTYYKNFFAHNNARNIRSNYPTDGTFDFEMINNLIYGVGGATGLNLGSKHTVLNNHYRNSSQQTMYNTICDFGTSPENTNGQGTFSETYAYISGNLIPSGSSEYSTNVIPYIKTTPYSSSGIVPIDASLIADDILSHVGASFPNRDAVDIRLVNQYNAGTGAIATSGTYPTIANGTAPSDTDNDGMPDTWETENGLDINDASDRNIVQPDGYTNLEYYLNGLFFLNNDGVNANAGLDQNICEGSSATLTASGGNTYLWSTGATTQSITVSPNATTTYTVIVSNENSSDTDDVIVTVNPNPVANAGVDVTISEGDITTLSASGGDSYVWSTGETTSSIMVSPNSTTTYTVIAILNGCEDSDDVTVTVETGQVTANAGEDVDICEGNGITLTANGGTDYLWSTGETTQSITVNPSSTTNYTVIVSNESSSDTDDVTVSVNPNPEVVVSNDATILEGNYITLSASGANNYEWSNGATQPNIAVSPNATTTYVVTGYINNCYDVKDVTVSVVEQVIVDAGADTSMCLGDDITLIAMGSGAEDFIWNTGETTQSITVSPEEDTMFTVIASNSLDSDADEIMVMVNTCEEEEIIPEEEAFGFEVYTDSRISNNILNVKISGLDDQCELNLFDISGKLIHTDVFNAENGQEIIRSINTSSISDGVYVLTIMNDDEVHSKNLVIR